MKFKITKLSDTPIKARNAKCVLSSSFNILTKQHLSGDIIVEVGGLRSNRIFLSRKTLVDIITSAPDIFAEVGITLTSGSVPTPVEEVEDNIPEEVELNIPEESCDDSTPPNTEKSLDVDDMEYGLHPDDDPMTSINAHELEVAELEVGARLNEIDLLNYDELKALATERGLVFKGNIKKVDLLKLLQGE